MPSNDRAADPERTGAPGPASFGAGLLTVGIAAALVATEAAVVAVAIAALAVTYERPASIRVCSVRSTWRAAG
jgi:hypothetical protein